MEKNNKLSEKYISRHQMPKVEALLNTCNGHSENYSNANSNNTSSEV